MLKSPEARAKLRRKLETWPDDRKSPVTINQGLELLDMVDRLEKENEKLSANNYGPEILNDPQAMTVLYFAGRMAEGREKNREIDNLSEKNSQLEKEANWLANKLVAATKMIANATGMETDDLNEDGWRKVAREAVESSNG